MTYPVPYPFPELHNSKIDHSLQSPDQRHHSPHFRPDRKWDSGDSKVGGR